MLVIKSIVFFSNLRLHVILRISLRDCLHRKHYLKYLGTSEVVAHRSFCCKCTKLELIVLYLQHAQLVGTDRITLKCKQTRT